MHITIDGAGNGLTISDGDLSVKNKITLRGNTDRDLIIGDTGDYIQTTATPPDSSNDNTLATTAFVHNLMGFKKCSIVNVADTTTRIGRIYRQGRLVVGEIEQARRKYDIQTTQGLAKYSFKVSKDENDVFQPA